jgi:hypothetical protein
MLDWLAGERGGVGDGGVAKSYDGKNRGPLEIIQYSLKERVRKKGKMGAGWYNGSKSEEEGEGRKKGGRGLKDRLQYGSNSKGGTNREREIRTD